MISGPGVLVDDKEVLADLVCVATESGLFHSQSTHDLDPLGGAAL